MVIIGHKKPVRKRNRLENYDYSQNGAYFITICSKDKQWLFWNVGASIARPQAEVDLSYIGKIIDEMIAEIPKRYSCVNVDNYVVMPNHIHLLLMVCADERGRAMHAPTPDISQVIQHLKGAVTKKVGKSIWQKSFYDHIVRDEKDYYKIYEYIDNNPVRWEMDSLNIW